MGGDKGGPQSLWGKPMGNPNGDPNPNRETQLQWGPQNGKGGNRRVYGEIHGVRNGGSQGRTSVSMGEPNGGP